MIPLASTPATATLRRRQVLAAGGVAALGLPYVAGCTGRERGASVRPAIDQVTALTSFATFGRDAYWYVAAAKGYFQEAHLDAQVQPGAGIDNLEQLAGGTAQFAAVDMTALAVNIGQGTTGITAIAAIHQLAAAALMTIDPDITTPRDLAGRTVAVFQGGTVDLLLPAYAAAVGLDPNEVNVTYAQPQQLPALLAGGAADAIEQFTMGLPSVQAAVLESGREVLLLPYSDELTNLYGVVIVTTEEIATEQPDLCRRFRDALLRGLDYSLTNSAEAGQILAEVDDSVIPEVAAAELQIMDAYSRLVNVPLGAIDTIKVSQHISTLEAIGRTPAGLVAEDIVNFDLAIAAG